MFVRAVTSMFNALPTPARHLWHAFRFVKCSYSYRRAANSIALYIVIPPLILHTFVGLGITRNESRMRIDVLALGCPFEFENNHEHESQRFLLTT
jgi:hypothetical protein